MARQGGHVLGRVGVRHVVVLCRAQHSTARQGRAQHGTASQEGSVREQLPGRATRAPVQRAPRLRPRHRLCNRAAALCGCRAPACPLCLCSSSKAFTTDSHSSHRPWTSLSVQAQYQVRGYGRGRVQGGLGCHSLPWLHSSSTTTSAAGTIRAPPCVCASINPASQSQSQVHGIDLSVRAKQQYTTTTWVSCGPPHYTAAVAAAAPRARARAHPVVDEHHDDVGLPRTHGPAQQQQRRQQR